MKLKERVREVETKRDDTESFTCRIVDGYYDVVEDGYEGSMPVIHLIGRDEDDEHRHITVDGYRPYFYVPKEEYQLKAEEIESDRRVLGVTDDCRDGLDPDKILDTTELVKIIVECPWHVRDLRDHFGRVWEADIRFIQRFLIDRDVSAFARVTNYVDEDTPLDPSDVNGVDDADCGVRTCTYDIEVLDEGEDVVTKSGTERAKQPVTAITAHDSLTDTYRTWALNPGDWPSQFDVIGGIDLSSPSSESSTGQSESSDSDNVDVDVKIDIFDNEEMMLGRFIDWLVERQFDVLTGWNSNSFDTPYLINRCFEREVWNVRELSPTRDVTSCDGNGRWINSDVKGVHLFDLLAGFKKTSFHSLKSNSLDNVAAEVTDVSKIDISDAIDADTSRPIDEAWYDHPSTFLEYNIADVVATVRINEARNIL